MSGFKLKPVLTGSNNSPNPNELTPTRSQVEPGNYLYHFRSITHNQKPGHGRIKVICLSEISMMPSTLSQVQPGNDLREIPPPDLQYCLRKYTHLFHRQKQLEKLAIAFHNSHVSH